MKRLTSHSDWMVATGWNALLGPNSKSFSSRHVKAIAICWLSSSQPHCIQSHWNGMNIPTNLKSKDDKNFSIEFNGGMG